MSNTFWITNVEKRHFFINTEAQNRISWRPTILFQEGRLCFDATEGFTTQAITTMLLIREKWHNGFFAIKNISAGEELAYDYLDRNREQQWLQEGQLVNGRVLASGDQRATSVNGGGSGEYTRAARHEEAGCVHEQVGSNEAEEEEDFIIRF